MFLLLTAFTSAPSKYAGTWCQKGTDTPFYVLSEDGSCELSNGAQGTWKVISDKYLQIRDVNGWSTTYKIQSHTNNELVLVKGGRTTVLTIEAAEEKASVSMGRKNTTTESAADSKKETTEEPVKATGKKQAAAAEDETAATEETDATEEEAVVAEEETVATEEPVKTTGKKQAAAAEDEAAAAEETAAAEEEVVVAEEAAAVTEEAAVAEEEVVVAEEAAAVTEEAAAEAVVAEEEAVAEETAAVEEPVEPVVASSTFKNYVAANAIDGDPNTAWFEGVETDGTGEYLKFAIAEEEIFGITILPGYTKNEKVYAENCVPAVLIVESGNSREIVDISDFAPDFENKTAVDYIFESPLAVENGSVTVIIDSVIPGTKSRHTGISE